MCGRTPLQRGSSWIINDRRHIRHRRGDPGDRPYDGDVLIAGRASMIDRWLGSTALAAQIKPGQLCGGQLHCAGGHICAKLIAGRAADQRVNI
jgi:hypothetical protein